MNNQLFEQLNLDEEHTIFLCETHQDFKISVEAFKQIWNLHPLEYHTLKIHGKELKTPRWQQAYGKNYRYTGAQNNALPIPPLLEPYLFWCQQYVHQRLNGLLLNWYDGRKQHYIGAHRDDTRDLIKDIPIVTISLGEDRTFRMRPWKQRGYKDLTVKHGDVLVIPWETNLKYTHEVPAFKKFVGKRISITLRAYSDKN